MLPQFSLAFLAVQGAVSPCRFDESCEVFQSLLIALNNTFPVTDAATATATQKSDSILLLFFGGGESESVVKVSIASVQTLCYYF